MFIQPMEPNDFEPYIRQSILDYAIEKQKTGIDPYAEALRRAKSEVHVLLPRGYFTKNHYFLSLINPGGLKMGLVWLYYPTEDPVNEAFIYDFQIFEPFRGQGLGQEALQTLFDYCQAGGMKKIALHVFAHNTRAYHVYQKLGFSPTDINMIKYL